MSNPIQKLTYIKVTDHSVSGENFELLYNDELDLLETFPQPSPDKLPEYYKSEDYISHTDSRRNSFEQIYHFAKGIALNRKLKLINQYAKSGKSFII